MDDARMQKRLASVQHIKQQWYYKPGLADEEPDPFDETCPTRMWRHKVRVWFVTLKRAFDQHKEPQREDAVPDVIFRL